MKVKILCAVLFSIFILTLFPSCDTRAKPEVQSASEKVSSVPASEIQQAPPSSADSKPQADRLASTVKKLKNDKTVEQYEVSHNSMLIAVIRRENDELGSFSLLNVSEEKEIPIPAVEKGNLYDPKWSFDDKYVSVEEGTAVQHNTFVLDPSSLKIRTQIGNTGMVWAPDSETAAFSTVNREIKPVIEMELDGTADLTIYNLDSLKSKRILKGTANIMYRPEKWDKSGLYVNKSTLNPNKTEIITVKPDTAF